MSFSLVSVKRGWRWRMDPDAYAGTRRRARGDIFGGSGRTDATASKNCAVAAYQSSMRRSLPVRRRVSGACPATRRFNRPCATTLSTLLASPDSMSPPRIKPVEPPWYVTRMPGGVGGAAPYPDPWSQSRRSPQRPVARCSAGMRLSGFLHSHGRRIQV